MKKTIAVIGSAAALSFAGAGLAAAQSEMPGMEDGAMGIPGSSEVEDVENADEVSAVAQQLCGAVSAYDFLGSVGGFAQGLEGEDCEANADAAIAAATSGDIAGAIDILRGIEAEVPGEDTDEVDEEAVEEAVEATNDAA